MPWERSPMRSRPAAGGAALKTGRAAARHRPGALGPASTATRWRATGQRGGGRREARARRQRLQAPEGFFSQRSRFDHGAGDDDLQGREFGPVPRLRVKTRRSDQAINANPYANGTGCSPAPRRRAQFAREISRHGRHQRSHSRPVAVSLRLLRGSLSATRTFTHGRSAFYTRAKS